MQSERWVAALDGIITVLNTPFDEHDRVDLPRARRASDRGQCEGVDESIQDPKINDTWTCAVLLKALMNYRDALAATFVADRAAGSHHRRAAQGPRPAGRHLLQPGTNTIVRIR
jgi:hypothetical protein